MRCISGADLWQWRQDATDRAIAAQVAPYEVDWFLQGLTDLTALDLRLATVSQRDWVAVAVSLETLEALWQRRLKERVPVQYLAGRTPWRQFLLRVTPAVLIPRPETEEMVDWAIALSSHLHPLTGHWADLGTGSGAIALGLASVFPAATIHAVDCSPAALAVARSNAEDNGLGDRIQFHQGHWFEPLSSWQGQLQGLLSNPPYIPHALLATLEPEVVQHEPHLALDGGQDGLDALRILASQAPSYLIPQGLWLVELMAGQGAAVADLLTATHHYTHIQIHTDLSGNERFVSARCQP